MQILVACVIIITCFAIYTPTVLIRRLGKLQKTMDQIEANTHKA